MIQLVLLRLPECSLPQPWLCPALQWYFVVAPALGAPSFRPLLRRQITVATFAQLLSSVQVQQRFRLHTTLPHEG